MTDLRLSCALCSAPMQPIVHTKQGDIAICPACLDVVEPTMVHPDFCGCGQHRPGEFCGDEDFSEGAR